MDSASTRCNIVLADYNPADVGLVRALSEHAIHCNLDVTSDGEEVLSSLTGLGVDSELSRPELRSLNRHLPKVTGEVLPISSIK